MDSFPSASNSFKKEDSHLKAFLPHQAPQASPASPQKGVAKKAASFPKPNLSSAKTTPRSFTASIYKDSPFLEGKPAKKAAEKSKVMSWVAKFGLQKKPATRFNAQSPLSPGGHRLVFQAESAGLDKESSPPAAMSKKMSDFRSAYHFLQKKNSLSLKDFIVENSLFCDACFYDLNSGELSAEERQLFLKYIGDSIHKATDRLKLTLHNSPSTLKNEQLLPPSLKLIEAHLELIFIYLMQKDESVQEFETWVASFSHLSEALLQATSDKKSKVERNYLHDKLQSLVEKFPLQADLPPSLQQAFSKINYGFEVDKTVNKIKKEVRASVANLKKDNELGPLAATYSQLSLQLKNLEVVQKKEQNIKIKRSFKRAMQNLAKVWKQVKKHGEANIVDRIENNINQKLDLRWVQNQLLTKMGSIEGILDKKAPNLIAAQSNMAAIKQAIAELDEVEVQLQAAVNRGQSLPHVAVVEKEEFVTQLASLKIEYKKLLYSYEKKLAGRENLGIKEWQSLINSQQWQKLKQLNTDYYLNTLPLPQIFKELGSRFAVIGNDSPQVLLIKLAQSKPDIDVQALDLMLSALKKKAQDPRQSKLIDPDIHQLIACFTALQGAAIQLSQDKNSFAFQKEIKRQGQLIGRLLDRQQELSLFEKAFDRVELQEEGERELAIYAAKAIEKQSPEMKIKYELYKLLLRLKQGESV